MPLKELVKQDAGQRLSLAYQSKTSACYPLPFDSYVINASPVQPVLLYERRGLPG